MRKGDGQSLSSATIQDAVSREAPEDSQRREEEASGSRRLLIVGGIALIIGGMVFGDAFAVFVLHQNANRIGEALMLATEAVAKRDTAAVASQMAAIGERLENRGTKVDAHVHATDFGYLALLIGLIQPFVSFSERARKRFAELFLAGTVILPIAVFAIHYAGLAYSPLSSIGWASIIADFGGLLVIVACAGELAGLLRYLRGTVSKTEAFSARDVSWASRALLTGGTLLILAGFLHGAFYAVVDLRDHETRDQIALETMINAAAAQQKANPPNMRDARVVVEGYGELQAEKAVNIAAHAHIIEFGLLAMLLAFLQPYVALSEKWKGRWAMVMLSGSVILPAFVLLELKLGLLAGGIADAGGFLVIVALVGMIAGVIRFRGESRPAKGAGQ